MTNRAILISALSLLLSLAGCSPVVRPSLTGVAHVAFYTSDLPGSEDFMEDFLGYGLVASGKVEGSTFKLSQRQFLTLLPVEQTPESLLAWFLLETDDLSAMARYLRKRGVAVPRSFGKDPLGEKCFFVEDPLGRKVGFVEYSPGGRVPSSLEQNLPSTRIAPHMSHVGFELGEKDFEGAFAFYSDLLGIEETWRNPKDKPTTIHLRFPDSGRTLEFLPAYEPLTSRQRASKDHICLESGNIIPLVDILAQRPCPEGCSSAAPIIIGKNRRRIANYYLPDGTRIELMDDHTIDEENN